MMQSPSTARLDPSLTRPYPAAPPDRPYSTDIQLGRGRYPVDSSFAIGQVRKRPPYEFALYYDT